MTGTPGDARPTLFVTGLRAEARIASGLTAGGKAGSAAGAGVIAVAGGGDAARLALLIGAALGRGSRAVISFGIAGGLEPGLAPGAVLLGRGVHDGVDRLPADEALLERLAALLPGARLAELAGMDAPAAGADDKARLRRRTGAAAVDMESHVAARLAALRGVPFAALRVVADPAERTLPPAALVGMRPDGTTNLGAVLRSLGRGPRQLPALVRTGLDARAAFAALSASRAALAPLFDGRAGTRALAGPRPDPGNATPGAVEPGAA